MTETDIVVVGAGVAGLAAASVLRAARVDHVLLEASSRIGGRALTTSPAALAGEALDHGASWLHAAERNPLVPMAAEFGDRLLDREGAWSRHLIVDGRRATAADEAAHDRAETRYSELAVAAASAPRDISLADAVAGMADDPWTASIETFEATLIAAADPRDLSVRDWSANALDGGNLNVAGGLGAFVARRLGQPAWLETPARRIDWWEQGGVAVETPRGTLRARAAIVTVSTGVLRAEAIRFVPPLPNAHVAALGGLPMGLLNKVALRVPDRLGHAAHTFLQKRVTPRFAPSMSFIGWPFGAAHAVGFVGGQTAWALSHEGEAAAAAFARDQLRAILGNAVPVEGAVVADWARDPWALGAYAYARVGQAGARAVLAVPLEEGRLIFAGEAVAEEGLAGTVGGAWNSGRAAARAAMRRLG